MGVEEAGLLWGEEGRKFLLVLTPTLGRLPSPLSCLPPPSFLGGPAMSLCSSPPILQCSSHKLPGPEEETGSMSETSALCFRSKCSPPVITVVTRESSLCGEWGERASYDSPLWDT